MNNINTDEFINDIIEIPIEHQQIVLGRMEKSKTDPERLLDWDEVSKDI
jgi:hypothetical protein